MKGKCITTIAVIAVFIVIVLTCATTSPLSQAEMKPNDPRMPYDIFDKDGELTRYWAGSRAPELPLDQICIMSLRYEVQNLSIDGYSVRHSGAGALNGYVFLPPGKHSLSFSYYETVDRRSGPGGNTVETVTINSPSVSLSADFEPGKWYSINASVTDVTSQSATASAGRYLLGLGGRYSASIGLSSSNTSAESFISKKNTVRITKYKKYLEPYDASVPFESQSFLETRDGVYIVGFNDDTVSWGWGGRDYSVTIGVPGGNNVLKLRKPGDKTIYTMTINCRPSNRYVFEKDSSGIIATNVTRGETFRVQSSTNAKNTPSDNRPQLPGYVTISGDIQTPKVGGTMKVNTDKVGGEGSLTIQWLRDKTEIKDAKDTSYTLTNADVGKLITVRATREGYSGAKTSTTNFPVIPANAPNLTGKITIIGILEAGNTLTVDTSGLSGTGEIRYQWTYNLLGDYNYGGETSSYKVKNYDGEVRVEVVRVGNYGSVSTSIPDIPSASSANFPTLTGKVTIIGKLEDAQTLMADTSGLSGNGRIQYSWSRKSGTNSYTRINGEYSDSYTVTNADVQSGEIMVQVFRIGNKGIVRAFISTGSH